MSIAPATESIHAALATVNDPEIRRPITELGMVESVDIDRSGRVRVGILLTVAGCPLKDTLNRDITAAVGKVDGVRGVEVAMGVMTEDQRKALQTQLRGGQPAKEIQFTRPSSLTKVYAIASGKGGVGKSSITVNLAAAMSSAGLSVGVIDADIYGHSVPRMLGVSGTPTKVQDMIMPPSEHGIRVISIGMFTGGNRPVVWRGPMLHRALEQFLADVYWGDLDVLIMDLPPGTGDIAISVAQLMPNAEILVVTTPQPAAAEVAERAGAISAQTRQQVAGVIENMSGLPCPHCGAKVDVFGSGGGAAVAAGLTRTLGYDVPLLGQVPIDLGLREGADTGLPIVLSTPSSPAAEELQQIADRLRTRARGLAGRSLGLTPVGTG